jgi:hypothetical protein
VQGDVFRQVETVCPPSRILLADADFNDFHSVLGFSLSPVRCVTDDFQGFSLRLFVRDGACFSLRIQTTKYSDDLVSAIAAVIARAAMLVAIGIVFI